MANVKKFPMSAVVNQIRHNERSIRHSGNPDICREKSRHNEKLSPERNISDYEYFLQRKSQLYCYGREDIKVLAGWVVTAPKHLMDSEEPLFFQKVYDFLSQRYGLENTISAWIHRDESGASHLHFLFIPVVSDPKRGGEKICAAQVLNRRELRNFHPALQSYLKENGIQAAVKTGITKLQGGNKPVSLLKELRDKERSISR